MYILTNKDNTIIHISETIRYEENGNILVDGGSLAIAVAPNEQINVYEVETVDEGIAENQYCYTEEKGFYKNENYKEPEPTDTQKIRDLQEQITDLQIALTEMYEGGM